MNITNLIQNAYYVLSMFGFLFLIWKAIQGPQEKLEKDQIVSEKTVDGKAALLAQQVQYTIESTDKRFVEMQHSIKESFAIGQNHIHSVDTKVDALSASVGTLEIQIAKLVTIIDERVPKK